MSAVGEASHQRWCGTEISANTAASSPAPATCRVAAAQDSELTQEELEAQVEAFMRRQAEIESGGAARKVEPGKVLGADEVSEEVSSQA